MYFMLNTSLLVLLWETLKSNTVLTACWFKETIEICQSMKHFIFGEFFIGLLYIVCIWIIFKMQFVVYMQCTHGTRILTIGLSRWCLEKPDVLVSKGKKRKLIFNSTAFDWHWYPVMGSVCFKYLETLSIENVQVHCLDINYGLVDHQFFMPIISLISGEYQGNKIGLSNKSLSVCFYPPRFCLSAMNRMGRIGENKSFSKVIRVKGNAWKRLLDSNECFKSWNRWWKYLRFTSLIVV